VTYIDGAAVVEGFAAAYLARVLRRHLRGDLRRDRLSADQAAAVVTTLRAIEQASARWQADRVTVEPAGVDTRPEPGAGFTSVRATASRLGIGEAAVRKRLRTGALAGRRTAAGRWLVDLNDTRR
jgi:hypothetical protein